ncbi:MAG TPA: tripartite tricarboxylate transporter substrate binding protein [Ramlibacter sp.]|nr:tripartite tricarboxylate transporter substrate binding protein [Ramlibacter sp.]
MIPVSTMLPALTRRQLLAASLLAAGASSVPAAFAQARYPTRQITLLCGFPPGGSTDFLARLVAQKLTEALGQPVVVENRGGANGLLAANATAAAPGDGYTLLLTSMGLTTNPYLYKNSRGDPVQHFTSIAMLASVPNVVVVSPSLQARTFDDLLALARSRSHPLTLATTGNAAPGHLASELLQRAAKVKFEFIPYKGSGPALNDMIAGNVDMSLPTVVAAAPHIKTGKLRALAVTGPKRSSLLPDVPTIAEAGLKDLATGSGWYALVGPANMPKDVVERISSEVAKMMRLPEIQERFLANGSDPMYLNPAQMTAFVARDYKEWGEVIKAANIKGAD